jgi:lipopolysaccharide biosynthesis protein
MDSATCTLFFHNYYGEHESWIKLFSEKLHFPFILCYNIVEDSIYNLDYDGLKLDRLRQMASGPWLKKMILRRSPNRGKDIGGKLVLIDALLREEIKTDYYIYLHDKKSPHKVQSREWQAKLFRIIEPSFMEQALTAFTRNKQTGIVAGADTIQNEYSDSLESYASHNRDYLQSLQSEFSIDTTNHQFVAGTMFWARSAPFLNFFGKYPPLDIRKSLEGGNILDETGGTVTHAWERLLSWLIFAQGYTIKGL